MGRPCCGEFRCSIPLASTHHRFCPTHQHLDNICSIEGCNNPVVVGQVVDYVTGKEQKKPCSLPLHAEREVKDSERGTGSVLLRHRLQRARVAYPEDSELANAGSPDLENVNEGLDVYTVTETPGNPVRLDTAPNNGTVGVDDYGEAKPSLSSTEEPPQANTVPEPCLTKWEQGNRQYKAKFHRTWTRNEQTEIQPCGIGYARATIYGAEAVSNHLIMTKNSFSVQGSKRPPHSFYDNNCLARQQAEEDDWFKGACLSMQGTFATNTPSLMSTSK